MDRARLTTVQAVCGRGEGSTCSRVHYRGMSQRWLQSATFPRTPQNRKRNSSRTILGCALTVRAHVSHDDSTYYTNKNTKGVLPSPIWEIEANSKVKSAQNCKWGSELQMRLGIEKLPRNCKWGSELKNCLGIANEAQNCKWGSELRMRFGIANKARNCKWEIF